MQSYTTKLVHGKIRGKMTPAVVAAVVAAGAAPGFVGTQTAVASAQPSTAFRLRKDQEKQLVICSEKDIVTSNTL